MTRNDAFRASHLDTIPALYFADGDMVRHARTGRLQTADAAERAAQLMLEDAIETPHDVLVEFDLRQVRDLVIAARQARGRPVLSELEQAA
ncbi:MAG: hypothetical protein EON87_13655 [Brevundimonas sp.]|nr:MAG: hypothetical protein EON87_13655 [Brevundimonas sp.]